MRAGQVRLTFPSDRPTNQNDRISMAETYRPVPKFFHILFWIVEWSTKKIKLKKCLSCPADLVEIFAVMIPYFLWKCCYSSFFLFATAYATFNLVVINWKTNTCDHDPSFEISEHNFHWIFQVHRNRHNFFIARLI